MPVFEHGDVSIHYEVFGDGFPLFAMAPGGLRSRVERWRRNPDRPDAPLIFRDPTEWLARHFRVIAVDQRNAGSSHAPITAEDGWHSYASDHLALLDHLGADRFHILGACIGASFALRLCADAPDRVAAAVLQNPIGLSATNQHAVDSMYLDWKNTQAGRHDVTQDQFEGFRRNMVGGDFVFSVKPETVRATHTPLLLLPGNDDIHAAEISRRIAELAPDIDVLDPWKGPAHRDATADRVETFLLRHTPDRYQRDGRGEHHGPA